MMVVWTDSGGSDESGYSYHPVPELWNPVHMAQHTGLLARQELAASGATSQPVPDLGSAWDFVSLRTPGSHLCAGEQKWAGPVPSPVPEDTAHAPPDPASQEAGTEVTMWFPPPCLCPQQLPVSTVGGHSALGLALPGAIL